MQRARYESTSRRSAISGTVPVVLCVASRTVRHRSKIDSSRSSSGFFRRIAINAAASRVQLGEQLLLLHRPESGCRLEGTCIIGG